MCFRVYKHAPQHGVGDVGGRNARVPQGARCFALLAAALNPLQSRRAFSADGTQTEVAYSWHATNNSSWETFSSCCLLSKPPSVSTRVGQTAATRIGGC